MWRKYNLKFNIFRVRPKVNFEPELKPIIPVLLQLSAQNPKTKNPEAE